MTLQTGASRVPQRETLLIPVSVRCTLCVAVNARGVIMAFILYLAKFYYGGLIYN